MLIQLILLGPRPQAHEEEERQPGRREPRFEVRELRGERRIERGLVAVRNFLYPAPNPAIGPRNIGMRSPLTAAADANDSMN